MKQTRIWILLCMLAVLSSCKDDSFTESPNTRHIIITAQMPDDRGMTRASLIQKEGSLDMLTQWDDGDLVQLYAEQDGHFWQLPSKDLFGNPIMNISENRKSCTFEFDLREEIDPSRPFTIYGFTGGLNGVVDEDLYTYGVGISRREISSEHDIPLYCVVESSALSSNSAKTEFKHFLTYEILHVKNTSSETITFTHNGYEVEDPWYCGTYLFRLPSCVFEDTDGKIIGGYDGGAEIQILSGESKSILAYYAPTGKKVSNARIKAVINGEEVLSSNTKSSDVQIETGKAYHLFATWDGNELKFSNEDIRETIIYPTSSYQLSEDGKTLVKWLGDEDYIDMSADPAFDQVIKIGDAAFYNRYYLQTIVLSNRIETIGNSAFDHTTLKNVTIPSSVKVMEFDAFACRLKKVYVKDLSAWCGIDFQSMLWAGGANPLEFGADLYVNDQLVKDLVIPEGVEYVETFAFRGWSGRSVTFPKSMKTVGYGSFMWSDIEQIDFGTSDDGIAIGGYAFDGCGKLPSTIDLRNVRGVAYEAFTSCVNIHYVSIGAKLTYLDANAFKGCEIKAYNVIEDNPLISSDNGVLYNHDKTILYKYPNGKEDSHYDVPASVKEIEGYAFQGSLYLDTVTLPEGMEELASYSFYYSDIIKVELPRTLKNIRYSAFYGCEFLSAMTLPEELDSIGNWAFEKCKSLERIVIPRSVSFIGTAAFSECEKLSDIQFPDNKLIYADAYIFNNTAWYENQPDGVIYIGNIALNFKGMMSENTKLSIKEGTLAIAERAFDNYEITRLNLSEIALPKSLKSIGNQAFFQCEKLKKVVSKPETPPQTANQTFAYMPLSDAVLYVPKASIGAYKMADGWKDFGRIFSIEDDLEGGAVGGDEQDNPVGAGDGEGM